MRRSRLVPLALLLVLSLPTQAAPPRIAAPAPLDALLQRYLKLEEPRDEVERQALESRLSREGSELLATEGYFDARLNLAGASLDQLVLEVEPGPRSLVETVQLTLDGPVPEARRLALQQAWSLKAGQPFRQADWSQAKEQLLLDLLDKDFPAARLTHSEAQVDAERQQVHLLLPM